MGLEFIDISRDDAYERPRVRSAASGQNTTMPERRRRSEGQRVEMPERRRRPEGQRIEMPERRRRPEGQRIEMPERRRRPEGQRVEMPERRRRPEGQRAEMSERRRRSEGQSAAVPERRRGTEVEIYPLPDNRNGRSRKNNTEQKAEQARARRRKRRQRRMIAARMVTLLFLVALIVTAAFLLIKLIQGLRDTQEVANDFQTTVERQKVIEENKTDKPIMTEDFIPVNEYSRPGETLPEVNNIFVHYTANPGTSAAQNRSYFENLGITGETSASAHFVIGYNGEIIQCIPLNEIAYAVAGRNYDSISIECCYLSEDGKFTEDTYQSLIRLSAWLLNEYNLAPEDMRRHYDEGGKKCPLYFVENVDSWQQFLNDLEEYKNIMMEQME